MNRISTIKALGLTLFLLTVSGSALAQNFCTTPTPPCNPDDPKSKCYVPPEPSCKCKPKECKKCTSSPAYAGSGVYETSALDLSVPTNGFPLEAARTYSSAHAFDGPIGIGWTSSFHARLLYSIYLYAAPSTYQKEAQVVMPGGDHLRFVDAGGGAFTAPEGRYDTLVRNGDGTFDLTLQRSRSVFHFGSDGRLESMTDDYGNALTLTYDTNGRLQRIADASGSSRYIDVYWGANGRISSLQDNAGRTIHYGYDTQGMLTSVTNPLSQVTTYAYVPGRFSPVLSSITDHWGRVISTMTWDAQGRVKSYTENGETYTYDYAWQGNASETSKIDAGGNRWVFPFGADGLISERRPPDVADADSSFTTYYADGSVQMSSDEVGVKTYYTYAGDGRVATVTKDYLGTQAVRFDYSYDPNFPEKVTSILPRNPTTGVNDPHWQGWQYEYYPLGSPAPGALHRIYRVKADGVTTELMSTYVYDAKGRVTSVTDGGGAVTDYVYDAAGNLQSVTAPSNNDAGTRPVTSYGYDAVGRTTSVTDPMGKVTAYTYDALDRVSTVTLPKPVSGSPLDFVTTYTYDNWDAATSLTSTHVTDPNSIVTRQGYDQFGRLRRSTDGSSNVTTYAYTRAQLSSITDANGNATTYGYDALGRLSVTVFPDNKAESYRYTADGLLRQKWDRKPQATSYTYDAHKRLKRKTYPNASYIEYTYTGQKLAQVYDNSVSPAEHTFTYDDSFRVEANTQASRGTITYAYGTNDATASMTTSTGASVVYTYYADGSMNTMQWSPVTSPFKYTYRLNGQYATLTMPNGQTRGYSYDDQGRLTQLANTHPTAGNLATFDYAYDLNHTTGAWDRLGQRVSMTSNVPAQSLTNALTKYAYDTNYQLTHAEYPAAAPHNGAIESWTYDAIGNRLTATVNGVTTNYTYQKIGTNPNNWQRLLSVGSTNYTYDGNGSTLTEGAETYTWDYENRLAFISGSAAVTYKYDYQGRRTSKTVGGVTTTYLYDGLHIAAEWSGTTTNHYVYGPAIDEPLAKVGGGAPVAYFTADGLGSVATLTNPSGATENTYVYDAWGVTRSATENVPQPFRYTAREVGDLPATMFYRARHYDTGLGRFFSEDPLRFSEGTNFYLYVANDPVIATDPSGLQYKKQTCVEGPWERVPGIVKRPRGSRIVWSLVIAREISLPAFRPGGPPPAHGWGKPVGTAADLPTGLCMCEYEMAGSVRDYDTWEKYKRKIYCDPCGLGREETRLLSAGPIRERQDSIFANRQRKFVGPTKCANCKQELYQ